MHRLFPVLCLLLAACAPAAAPARPNPPAALPTSTAPALPTLAPTEASPSQPAGEEPTAAPPPAAPAANQLWLQVLSHQDGDTVNTPTIQLKGQAPAETVLTINDQILVVSADQVFEVELTLEAGPNLIEIVASDLNGNEIFLPLTIEYEP